MHRRTIGLRKIFVIRQSRAVPGTWSGGRGPKRPIHLDRQSGWRMSVSSGRSSDSSRASKTEAIAKGSCSGRTTTSKPLGKSSKGHNICTRPQGNRNSSLLAHTDSKEQVLQHRNCSKGAISQNAFPSPQLLGPDRSRFSSVTGAFLIR